MSLQIKPASRVGVIPWIDLYSESGCGKTYSSLLLARGIAGPKGKIVLADSESGRGSLYADVLPGGYDVLNFGAPFSPAIYREVAQAIFDSGAAVGIIDSMSHEWEGMGGVLDLAAEAEHKSGKPGLHNWRVPKMEHALLMQLLLRSPIPLICCVRAKYKTRQARNAQGKTEIVKDDYTSPIQSEEFIFEATAHAEILQDHKIRLTKCSHPELRKCFPTDRPITIADGEAIARWCAAPTAAASAVTKPDSATKILKKQLWDLTQGIHGGNAKSLEQWLWDEAIISDTESLAELTVERLPAVIKAAQDKLAATAAAQAAQAALL